MPARPRTKNTGGSWSDTRIDGGKPFNLKFYPNETRIGQWREIGSRSRKGHYYNPDPDLLMPKNSFSVEKMCFGDYYDPLVYPYSAGYGSKKGCYYPAVHGGKDGKDSGKGYGTPTLIYTLRNDKGENVSYGGLYGKANIENLFSAFNPLSIMTGEWTLIRQVNESKLGNDGKVYGTAFVALFPALPDVPQVHPSYYETHSAESATRLFFTEYNEAKYLSQLDGRLASNTVNFEIQILEPTPIITVKKKQVRVL